MVTAAFRGEVLLPIFNPIEQTSGVAEDERVVMIGVFLVEIVHRGYEIPIHRPTITGHVIVVVMADDLEGVEPDIRHP